MLEFELASRQSPSVRELENINLQYESSDGYELQLLELAVDPKMESSATWLIKRWLEDRKSADRSFAIRLLDLLTLIRGWQAKLHLLQCLQYLELTGPDVPVVRVEILGLLDSSNKLVRAWAYDGLYRLAQLQHSNSAADMIRLNQALQEESPAVRARIRNLLGDRDI